MRKVCIFFVLLLAVAILAIPALAVQTATMTVSVSAKTLKRGDTVTVTVSTTKVDNCTNGGFVFTFDKNVFEYVSGKALGGVANYTAGVSTQAGNIAGYFMNGNESVQGNLFQIVLKVKSTAAPGTYSISGRPNMTATDGKATCTNNSVSVTITCNHSYGGWSNAGNGKHSQTCSLCGDVQSANHTWNSGTVTKPADCKETGTKSFSCTACSATKTEDIPKTNDHKYGDWTNASATQHKHTCTVCSKEETANHTWGSGVVTTKPTCKDTGVKTYTCACGATKTEDIDKTNDHTYGSWTKVDDTTHMHTCTVCSKEETANHTWGSGVVTTKPNCKDTGVKTYTCACGATKTEDIDKTNDHTYGSWTKVDDTTHKHTCTVCSKEETANHTWGSGVVTTKPTCKDTGVKTYTCACSATKTEDIDKTNDHKYSKWTDMGDGNHKHICSVCSKEETAAHTWNKGAVTKPASCKEIGTKAFTCTGCGLTRTEDIPMLTTHKYDHGCDKDCNVCGAVRTTSHKYKTSWSKDKSGHWHECSECKDKKDFSAHKPGAAATETTAQTCTTCGYVITAALGHKHNYSTDWTTNEAGHWHACSGCATQDSYAAHSFENDCDTDCSVCGYVRTAGHTYKTEWSSDGEKHWHECTGCGLKADEGEHIPGAAATETTGQTCTSCGYELAPALGTEPATTPATDPVGSQDNDDIGNTALIIATCAAGVVAIGGGAALTVTKKKK